MKLSIFPFLLLAVSAEVISSRDLQEDESDFPSLVPTISPPPTMAEGSDIPSDLPSDFVSDPPSGGIYTSMPPVPPGVTLAPVTGTVPTAVTLPPSTGDETGTATPTATPVALSTSSSSSIVSSCAGLVLAVAGLCL
ncbi:hypothetical protein FisN_7Lh217 [Fistulifera solaris]|uniref:Uncharacterized protein n=1 Tax=Fistulifera solaris TaxID=1519565 RepID=A0A1Z5JRV6_FISSO|nr:hypothetical protein FisN_7Lh217 [Fistulifera solaris]|eukprot:GAX16501.1 hypothetical protein FisN_7Lh217 [Fistulifera solaris]